jgi:hypothetical protein
MNRERVDGEGTKGMETDGPGAMDSETIDGDQVKGAQTDCAATIDDKRIDIVETDGLTIVDGKELDGKAVHGEHMNGAGTNRMKTEGRPTTKTLNGIRINITGAVITKSHHENAKEGHQ